MITLLNTETNETAVIKQMFLDEALKAARSEHEAEFLERYIKEGSNCFATCWESGALELSITWNDEREFANQEFQLSISNVWQIKKTPHLKLVS